MCIARAAYRVGITVRGADQVGISSKIRVPDTRNVSPVAGTNAIRPILRCRMLLDESELCKRCARGPAGSWILTR